VRLADDFEEHECEYEDEMIIITFMIIMIVVVVMKL
jgi:hypothetical protein